MTDKQLVNMSKFLNKSIKANLPKFVRLSSIDEECDEFFIRIPIEKRMNSQKEYKKLSSELAKWAKSFGYEEYGSGTAIDSDEYNIHFGPSNALINDHMKRTKKILKNAIDNIDDEYDLKSIIKCFLTDGFIDESDDVWLHTKAFDAQS